MIGRRPYSLAARLALATAAWSALALLITGAVITELLRRDEERVFDARIEAHLVELVRSFAQVRERPSDDLDLEPLGALYREPFSGWAWQVRRGKRILAQSVSLGPAVPGVMEPLEPPGEVPADFIGPGGIPSRGMARAVVFPEAREPLIFAVAGPREEIDGHLAAFSRLLLYSLGAFAVVMFLASLPLARILLVPVSRLGDVVRRMRLGEPGPRPARWPREIAPVVQELADLHAHVTRMVQQSRNQASDLAHALKTPLSVIHQEVERLPPERAAPLIEQLGRIERSLDWHLSRRRLAGAHKGRVDVAAVSEDVLFAVSRLFEARHLEIESRIAPGAEFVGDEEDLHELLGNVLENACKWARRAIVVEAEVSGDRLEIRLDDDGPGIPDAVAGTAFRRGGRLDETAPGHGHGLAIVRDIVESYGGTVTVGRSTLGGTSIGLRLPGALRSAAA